jgi:hypothetical protein
MLRTFIVKQDTNFKSLGGALLDARFGGAQADAAAAQLRALNPHADLDKLKAGTVIFVPDLPQFKPSAATSTQAGLVDDFQKLVAEALDTTAQKIKLASAERATERAEVGAVLKGAALRKIIGADKDVALQVDGAQKAMANEEKQDKQSQESFATMSKAALEALAQISKLVG